MKIRMKVAVSGSRNGQPWPAFGEVAELPDDEGAELCARGFAEPVAEKPKAEKAVAPDDAEQRSRSAGEPLTTETAEPVRRSPGRPRTKPE